MSGAEQSECQTAVPEQCQEPTVVENASETDVESETNVEIEPVEEKEDEARAVAATSAEASANDTLTDIFPHTFDLKKEESEADHIDTVELPTAEDTVADTQAEPRAAKVLSEETQHEACMPGCLKSGSVSTPSTLKALNMSELDVLVVPENANVANASIQDDTTEPPKAQAVDVSIGKENAGTSNHADDKLTTAETSGPSKETTEEGKGESSSDADTNPSDQDPVAETQVQDKTPSIDGSDTGVRTFRVLAVPPQDLFFVAPPDCKPGQLVWIQGPHGPLQVQAPAGVKPGQRVMLRLGAPFQHKVTVPPGAKPGDAVTFTGENDSQLQAIVPRGKKPGQDFLVSPPVTMLRIPDGAIAGDQLLFKVPVGFGPDASKTFQERGTAVPPNMAAGQYFAAMVSETPQAPGQNDGEEWI